MAAKTSSPDLVAALAAKAAQIPSLRAVRLEADYVPARLPSGKVTGIWGTALIRTPDGDLRELVVGDEIRKGDVIMTSQNGIVEIDDAGSRLARFPGTEGLEQILTDLPPTAAGPSSDPGSLQPGVRVDRLSESVTGQAYDFNEAERSAGAGFTAAPLDVTPPALTVSSPTVTEGTGPTSGFAVFTVTLTTPNPTGTTVSLSTQDGTATGGGTDFGAIEVSTDGGTTYTPGTTVVVPPGSSTVLVRVPITPDTLDEPAETFTLTATSPDPTAPGTATSTTGTATIVDDDPTPTVVTVTPVAPDTSGDNIADVPEGSGGNGNAVSYTVTLSNASSLPITYAFGIAGTGVNPADPANDLAQTITFGAGVTRSADGSTITVAPNTTTFSITVTTNPDLVDENNERFNVTVGGVSGAADIIDDDGPPVIDTDGPGNGTALLAYVENAAPAAIAPLLTMVDPDSDAISGATVAITAGFKSAEDVLALGTGAFPAAITGTFNATTGVLTLTGNATVAQYQAALASVTYANLSEAPDANPRTVSFVAFDDLNRPSAASTATVTVTPVNDTPLAVADALQATEDTPITYAAAALLDNDTDVDNIRAQLSIASVTSSDSGLVALNADGTVTFTPNQDFNGTTTFTYTTTDGLATSAPQTVTITVAPVNDAPVAVNDALAAVEDTAITYTAAQLLGNDTDIDSPNSALTIASVTSGANGTAVLNPDGTVTFTPNANFNGTANFTYTTTDGTATGLVPATVSVTVAPVNDAPVAVNDALAAVEDTAITYTAAQLLGNDTDIDSPNSALTIASVTSGTNGTAVLNPDGTVTFTPNANFNGTANFTYTISDGSATSLLPATATITIAPVNDLPTITVPLPTNLAGRSTDEDTPLVFSTANGNAIRVTDIDGDVLSTTLTVANGTLTLGSTTASSITVNGTAAVINAALEGLSYSNPPDYFTHRNGSPLDVPGIQLTVSVSDPSAVTPVVANTLLVVNAVTDIASFQVVTQQNTASAPVSLAPTLALFESDQAVVTRINGEDITVGGPGVNVTQGGTAIGLFTLTNAGLVYKPATDFVSEIQDDFVVQTRITFTVSSGNRTESTDFNVQVNATPLPTTQSPLSATAAAQSADGDTLTGLEGRDVFAWTLADRGAPGTPHAYTIDNFGTEPALNSSGGDVLDLRDLLSNANGTNLGTYLGFETTGGSTLVSVSSTGQGQPDVTIKLAGVDLAAAIGVPNAPEDQIISELVKQGKLLADHATSA